MVAHEKNLSSDLKECMFVITIIHTLNKTKNKVNGFLFMESQEITYKGCFQSQVQAGINQPELFVKAVNTKH